MSATAGSLLGYEAISKHSAFSINLRYSRFATMNLTYLRFCQSSPCFTRGLTSHRFTSQTMVSERKASNPKAYITRSCSRMLQCGVFSGESAATNAPSTIYQICPLLSLFAPFSRDIFFILVSGISVFWSFNASDFIAGCMKAPRFISFYNFLTD